MHCELSFSVCMDAYINIKITPTLSYWVVKAGVQ